MQGNPSVSETTQEGEDYLGLQGVAARQKETIHNRCDANWAITVLPDRTDLQNCYA